MTSDESLAAGAFIDYLGLELTTVEPDLVEGTWTAGPHLHQPYGIVHGGAHCAVVETLASIAAGVWLGSEGKVVGVNNNTDFYRAVTEGAIASRADPVHRGRSQQVWIVESRDAQGRLVSRGQVRLQNLRGQA